jgi:diacylglycerol kinase (ATP)
MLPHLREFLKTREASLEYCEPASAEETHRVVAAAVRDRFERVLIAGGDGTAHAALNALRGTATAFGVLPLGHGNDMARALGVPLEPRAAAEFLLRAPVAAMDVARVGERVYGAVAGAGFDAATNERANRMGPWLTGQRRYFMAGLATIFSYRPQPFELVTDAEEFSGEAMWVAVANGPCYGGGIRIAPEARVDDGLLDVCIVERISALALLALYPALGRGEHLRSRSVRYFRCTRVQFRGPAGPALYGDGEFLGRLPLEIRLEPAAVQAVRAAP